jgi:hypothetical protein
MDLAEESTLPKMLLSAALRRNLAGPVLFSTTRPELLQGYLKPELTTISNFAALARRASTEMIETS